MRWEVGSKLSRQEREQLLSTAHDVYRDNNVKKVLKGLDSRDEEIWGWPYEPDLFIKSDLTGHPCRFYITLPDGRKAHPSELFPEKSRAQWDQALEIELAKQRREVAQQKQHTKDKEARIVTPEMWQNGSDDPEIDLGVRDNPMKLRNWFLRQAWSRTGRSKNGHEGELWVRKDGAVVFVDKQDPEDQAFFTAQGFQLKNTVKESFDDDFDNLSSGDSIAASLSQAAKATDQHNQRQLAIMNQLPDGTTIKSGRKIWTKITLAGDVFWTDGKKYVANVVMEVGSEAASEVAGVDMFNPPPVGTRIPVREDKEGFEEKDISINDLRRATDPIFLRNKERSKEVHLRIVEITPSGTIITMSNSVTLQQEDHWTQTVKLLDWDEALAAEGLDFPQRANLAVFGRLQVKCNCPAYLYWGYEYIETQLGSDNIEVPDYEGKKGGEDRFPKVRNPKLRGVICKHLTAVLLTLQRSLPEVASAMKSMAQAGKIKIGSGKVQNAD